MSTVSSGFPADFSCRQETANWWDPRQQIPGDEAHDPRTGEEIEKSEVVKGYEYQRGQFVTFSAEELKALDVASSRVIDLETFVIRSDIDPVLMPRITSIPTVQAPLRRCG